jgi:hypothetical protein
MGSANVQVSKVNQSSKQINTLNEGFQERYEINESEAPINVLFKHRLKEI